MIKKIFFIAFVIINVNMLAQTPVLKNFEIRDSNPNRVYFTAEGDISGLTTQGFVISGKTITSINTSGNYFTVSPAFTFWDNNTIRLGEITDTSDRQTTIHNFTLTYIENNIDEPVSSGTEYFVDAAATGTGDGLSETNAFTTIQEGLNAANSPGSTIWVKAGTYVNTEGDVIRGSGTIINPIKIIGYKNTPGDISSMYYNFNSTQRAPDLDPTEMPIIDGTNVHKAGLRGDDKSYIIVRNMQVTNYTYGINFSRGRGIVIDNCVTKDMYGTGAIEGAGFSIDKRTSNGASYSPSYYRIKNSISINAGMSNIHTVGAYNLIDNCKSYNDKSGGGSTYGTDYYYNIMGDFNILRKSSAEAIDNTVNGSSHGLALRGPSSEMSEFGATTSYNLIELCFVKTGSNQGAQSRNPYTHNNVFKDIEITGFGKDIASTGNGISNQTGAHNNIYERMHLHDLNAALIYMTGSEGGNNPSLLHTSGNIINNSIIENVKEVINSFNILNVIATYDNNKVYNTTINNVDYMNDGFNYSMAYFRASNNEFVNCIINNVRNENASGNPTLQTMWGIDHSNFYGGFSRPTWTSNSLEVNPQFESSFSFKLNVGSELIDKGKDLISVKLDYNKNPRPQGSSMDIGAFEFGDNSTGSINANAGSDQVICLGESVTLTASGGSTYSWNTGETTTSITVSPAETTTYTVTAFDGTESDADSVVVTVNEAPSVNAGSDISICLGENITLTATGIGDFLWSTGETTSSITVSPITTTTYTVIASNSCENDASDQVIVTVNAGVTLDVGNDREICLGETITLTAQSNGAVLWSTGETTSNITINPLSTTTYTVTSTLGDCSKTDQVLVTVNEAPSVNAGADISICSGENITLTAEGTGNFLWSTGETTSSIIVSPIATTTYTVTASNSCAYDATDQVIVTVNDKPTVSVSNDITIENGSSTILTASGDGNFLWSTGETTSSITVSPSITTTYSVTLTSQQGCSEANSIEVTVTNNSETTVTADAGPDQDVCLDAIVELTASGGDSYLWSTGETTPSITVSPNETTTYTVTVSNGNSIDFDDITVYVDENCSEIANRSIIQEFKVYPNPTNGILHIELSGYSNELNLSLYNATGKIIHSDIISNYSLDKSLKRNINLRKYGKGVYYARIVNNGKNETKKVIVM